MQFESQAAALRAELAVVQQRRETAERRAAALAAHTAADGYATPGARLEALEARLRAGAEALLSAASQLEESQSARQGLIFRLEAASEAYAVAQRGAARRVAGGDGEWDEEAGEEGVAAASAATAR